MSLAAQGGNHAMHGAYLRLAYETQMVCCNLGDGKLDTEVIAIRKILLSDFQRAEKVGPDKHASWEGLPTRCAELSTWRADVLTFAPAPHRLEFSHGIVNVPVDAEEFFL